MKRDDSMPGRLGRRPDPPPCPARVCEMDPLPTRRKCHSARKIGHSPNRGVGVHIRLGRLLSPPTRRQARVKRVRRTRLLHSSVRTNDRCPQKARRESRSAAASAPCKTARAALQRPRKRVLCFMACQQRYLMLPCCHASPANGSSCCAHKYCKSSRRVFFSAARSCNLEPLSRPTGAAPTGAAEL